VFAEAHERLPHLVERPDYRDVVFALVREAVIRLNTAELLVRMDTATRRILTDATLDQVSREMGVELQAGDPLEHGVGVVVETPDGHRRYDNTLDSRLTEMQQPLRAPVYHLLMGEDL
jgi:vacuolar-type H+-ATPase subunit E/Vma4